MDRSRSSYLAVQDIPLRLEGNAEACSRSRSPRVTGGQGGDADLWQPLASFDGGAPTYDPSESKPYFFGHVLTGSALILAFPVSAGSRVSPWTERREAGAS